MDELLLVIVFESMTTGLVTPILEVELVLLIVFESIIYGGWEMLGSAQ